MPHQLAPAESVGPGAGWRAQQFHPAAARRAAQSPGPAPRGSGFAAPRAAPRGRDPLPPVAEGEAGGGLQGTPRRPSSPLSEAPGSMSGAAHRESAAAGDGAEPEQAAASSPGAPGPDLDTGYGRGAAAPAAGTSGGVGSSPGGAGLSGRGTAQPALHPGAAEPGAGRPAAAQRQPDSAAPCPGRGHLRGLPARRGTDDGSTGGAGALSGCTNALHCRQVSGFAGAVSTVAQPLRISGVSGHGRGGQPLQTTGGPGVAAGPVHPRGR